MMVERSWEKLTTGFPTSNDMGKIGLAISPQKPDVIYTLRLNWTEDARRQSIPLRPTGVLPGLEMSDAVAGGTGPHYYQELYASPHEFDKIYLPG
jgi:hypothetical protein